MAAGRIDGPLADRLLQIAAVSILLPGFLFLVWAKIAMVRDRMAPVEEALGRATTIRPSVRKVVFLGLVLIAVVVAVYSAALWDYSGSLREEKRQAEIECNRWKQSGLGMLCDDYDWRDEVTDRVVEKLKQP